MKIKQFECETKEGNRLSFFYNPENNLIVIDLIAKNEEGGNEIFRKTIDETSLLSFLYD